MLDNTQLLGFAYPSLFRTRAAYARSVETTIYLDEKAHSQGKGTKPHQALLHSLEREDVHRAYGRHHAARSRFSCSPSEAGLQPSRPFPRSGLQIWSLLGCGKVGEEIGRLGTLLKARRGVKDLGASKNQLD